jgi:ribose transport system substrate-binding protein
MKKQSLTYAVLATLLVLTFVLAGCAQPAPQPAAQPTQVPASEPTKAPAAAAVEKPAASSMTAEQGEKLVRTIDPKALPAGWKTPKNVGHVTNYLVHEWYQNLTKGEEARSKDYGITFSINDANLDLQKSLAAVDDYLAKGTEAIVFTPVNEKASGPTIQKAVKSVPVVCESSPTDGCTSLVSIDDFVAGQQVGIWAGNYVKANFGGKAVILDVGLPALTTTVARSDGFVAGVKSILPDAIVAQSVDGKGLKDEAVKVSADALTAHPDVNIIFGINDDSALGGLQAFEAAGMDTSKVLVVGFGCEGKACKNALMEGGPYKVSAAMFPEYQGRLLIDAAVAALNGTPLPAHIVAPTLAMTKEQLATYYAKDGDNFAPIFDAIAKLPFGKAALEASMAAPVAAGAPDGEAMVRTLDPKALPAGWKLPATVGHVTNYLVHEWYQNETKGEQARADDYGIKFSINDANLDLQKSLAAVDDYLAKGTNALVFTPVNEKASGPTITKAAKSMPVVCEGSPTDGCVTLVSIDDFKAGENVGIWAGNYVKANFGGKAVVLDVGLPALTTTVARSDGFAAGLKSVLPDAVIAQSVDGKGLKDEAVKVSADALTAHPDVNIIFGINDDSALGGLQAFEAAGMDTSKVLVVGFGCEGKACKNALMEGGPYKVSAAMFPEYQGRLLVDAAIAAFNGVKLPAHIVSPSTPITADNLAQFYSKDGDNYMPIFEAMAKLPVK